MPNMNDVSWMQDGLGEAGSIVDSEGARSVHRPVGMLDC